MKSKPSLEILEFVMGFYQKKSEEDFNELCRKTYGKNHNIKYSPELSLCQWASDKAYRDVCRTITFSDADKDHARMKKRMDATKIICDRIGGLNLDTNYDQWHQELCEKIDELYDGFIDNKKLNIRTLSVGQIQKWINMTMKWLWIYTSTVDSPEYFQGISAQTDKLHIPLDSYILAYIKENHSLQLSQSSTWSQITDYEKVYRKYQENFHNILGETQSPIEWELANWKNALNMNIKN